jgi:hypothetical protein
MKIMENALLIYLSRGESKRTQRRSERLVIKLELSYATIIAESIHSITLVAVAPIVVQEISEQPAEIASEKIGNGGNSCC